MLEHKNYALGAKIYFQRENEGTMGASIISPVICTGIEVTFLRRQACSRRKEHCPPPAAQLGGYSLHRSSFCQLRL